MSLASVACATSGRLTVRRRRTEDSVLHRVVREHLETFLAEAQAHGSVVFEDISADVTLPKFAPATPAEA